MSENAANPVHWSFWVIGVVALLFNLAGCMNFVMQLNPQMVAELPEAYRVLVESRPAWATGAFAIAVFGGLIGCALLLLRKSSATYAFGISLLGAVATQIPAMGIAHLPTDAWVGWASQLLVGALLIWYSIWCRKRSWTT